MNCNLKCSIKLKVLATKMYYKYKYKHDVDKVSVIIVLLIFQSIIIRSGQSLKKYNILIGLAIIILCAYRYIYK